MKILKIYSNDKNFKNITFNKTWLNVIVWEISDRHDYTKDTHNLWKSLLRELINFLLLKQIKNKDDFFLTKNQKFEDHEFYIEILLNSWKYLVLKRCVKKNTKISIKINSVELEWYDTDIKEWTHKEVAIWKATDQLNEYLWFDILKNYKYRKFLDYFIRSQEDFLDVFKLNKFKWKDKDWKPMVLELLNFDSSIYKKKIECEEELDEIKWKIRILRNEHKVDENKIDKLKWIIDIENDKKNEIEKYIDDFNFAQNYKDDKNKLVDDLDIKIENLNSYHYSIKSEIQKGKTSLDSHLDYIDIEKLKWLYSEIDLLFPENIISSYEDLLKFNKEISSERIEIIKSNLSKLEYESREIESEINKLESEKSTLLTNLTDRNSYKKFKHYQKELAKKEADIIFLEKKLEIVDQINSNLKKQKEVEKELDNFISDIRDLILTQKHKDIRRVFSRIILNVLNSSAVISLTQNNVWNIEFLANYQNIENMEETDEGKWNSYKKILCSALDLSLLSFYSSKSFYRFIYHDWILDNLDIRKSESYLNEVREMCKWDDTQYILTVFDSQLSDKVKKIDLEDEEIRLRLSDKDDASKLFWFTF